MIYKIHHLKCGSMCPVCAPLFGQKGLKAEIVCHCLLVETDRGLVLIDTGFGLQDYLHMQQRLGSLVKRLGKIESNLEFSAIQQIQKLGFHPKDVQHIFVTHLDFDHAGGISDFPHATVHVLAAEYNAAQLPNFKGKLRYRTNQYNHHRYWNFIEYQQGEKWFNLEKVKGFPLFQDEILMIPLLGHSAGHCGIAIKQQNQWLLFCGDAYYSHLELNSTNKLRSLKLIEKTFAEDNNKRLINLKKLQYLAQHEPNIEIICAHDPYDLRRYQT
ncbi:MBL fold metallo-hydrolase [Acinetobacter sp.]|jgi:glyoxylase-like metal-dependent hydrolase (beta-lactamase superfamily II)|uniref:MBL fold metallo-hydrolase n=1 Tax=Acinetobacter sp. TaxID=472 RepID=UPI002819E0FC|nr:MBL fold metallo-hydrolase [Acinetobacter sp.]MDR2248307.1 MBL fold metallo-hydrolase [Acinetobacter sp.]